MTESDRDSCDPSPIAGMQQKEIVMIGQEQMVIAVFSNAGQAQDAVTQLRDAGFVDSQIGIISQDLAVEHENTFASEGATTGVAVGASAGILWGMGIVAGVLPAIGPAIAGGTLAALLSSAAVGAATAGIAGALLGMGIAREEAEEYEDEVGLGRTLIVVHPETRDELAVSILLENGADRAERHGYSEGSTVEVPIHRRELVNQHSTSHDDLSQGAE